MIHTITKNSLVTIIVIFALSAPAVAQLTRIGGGLSFSTGIEDVDHKTGNPGITARGVLELGDKFWLIPGVTFYMPGKRQGSITSFGTLDADVTFRMATEKTILFYALAGGNLSYIRTSFDVRATESKLMPALNIGTGIEMIVEKDFNAFAQIKGVVGSYKQYLVISIGVHYYIKRRRYKTW